jgi:hypothetical protein
MEPNMTPATSTTPTAAPPAVSMPGLSTRDQMALVIFSGLLRGISVGELLQFSAVGINGLRLLAGISYASADALLAARSTAPAAGAQPL